MLSEVSAEIDSLEFLHIHFVFFTISLTLGHSTDLRAASQTHEAETDLQSVHVCVSDFKWPLFVSV